MNEHRDINIAMDAAAEIGRDDGHEKPEPQQPEPVYEYRVVCAGHRVTPWVGTYEESVAAVTLYRANAACPWRDEEQHSHAIERRVIGPWERRVIGPWEAT